MIAVFASWQGRIAPVLDVATEMTVVTVDDRRVTSKTTRHVASGPPLSRAQAILETGCEVLVCGAISRPMQAMIAGHGVRVIGFVTGELNQVIDGWLSDSLASRMFIMPGCGPRRRRRGRSDSYPENPGDTGAIASRDHSRGREGHTGYLHRGFGPQGQCVCPQCGHRATHHPGTPCSGVLCPKCGARMTRERENDNL